MQSTRTDSPEGITILRVKRKREQEPLEALLIHRQKKRPQYEHPRHTLLKQQSVEDDSDTDSMMESTTLFSLGETISEMDFRDAQKRQALQDRLTSLYNGEEMDAAGIGRLSLDEKPKRQQSKFRVMGKREVSMTSPAVIPKVLGAEDMEKGDRLKIKMYDAVNETEIQPPLSPMAVDNTRRRSIQTLPPSTSHEERMMDELVPMVDHYLSFEQQMAPEYMYDFYYTSNNNRPTGDNVGSVMWIDDVDEFLGEESEDSFDDEDEDSNAEDYYANDYPDEDDGILTMDEYYDSEGEPDLDDDFY